MVNSIKPGRGIQLNRNHPLTRDMIHCLVFNEGTGSCFDHIQGPTTLHNSTVFPPWQTTEEQGVNFNSSDRGFVLTDVNVTDQLTVFAVVKADSAIGYSHICGMHPGWFLSGDADITRFGVNTGTETFAHCESAGTSGVQKSYAGVYNGIEIRTFADGAFYTSAAKTGNIDLTGHTRAGIYWNGSIYYYTGVINLIYVWKRALSDAEIAYIDANRYEIFGYTNPMLLVSGAATYYKTLSLDALLKKANNLKTLSIDSYLQKTLNLQASIDSLLQQTSSKTLSIDAILTSTSGILITNLDAYLQKTLTKTSNIDALLRQTFNLIISIDAYLQRAEIKTVNIDALLLQTREITLFVDALLKKENNLLTLSIDSELIRQGFLTTQIDAIIRKVGIVSLSLDSYITLAGAVYSQGLEYTLKENKLQFTSKSNKLHYTIKKED